MKRSILYSTLITSLAAPAVIGHEGATRIGVNYRLGYNISASFSGLTLLTSNSEPHSPQGISSPSTTSSPVVTVAPQTGHSAIVVFLPK